MSDDNNDDPKNNRKNVPTRSPSPMGTVRVPEKTEYSFVVEEDFTPEHFIEVDLSRDDINHEEEVLGVTALLWIDYDGPNPMGIEGGRITRMTLTQGEKGHEEILAHFENGKWEQEAETPLAIQVKMRMQRQENGLEMPDVKPAFDQALEQKPKLKP